MHRHASQFSQGPPPSGSAGRIDAQRPDATGRLPAEDFSAAQLKQAFQQQGLSVQEFLALAGAHTVCFLLSCFVLCWSCCLICHVSEVLGQWRQSYTFEDDCSIPATRQWCGCQVQSVKTGLHLATCANAQTPDFCTFILDFCCSFLFTFSKRETRRKRDFFFCAWNILAQLVPFEVKFIPILPWL